MTPSCLLRSLSTLQMGLRYSRHLEFSRNYFYTGWSVYTGISLLRGDEDPDCSISNIGELLKSKAE